MPDISFDNFNPYALDDLDTFGDPEDYLKPKEDKEIGESWDRRKDGRSEKETVESIVGGNTREIQACPSFRNKCHELFVQGKLSFDVIRFESLTDIRMDKTNKYRDIGDSWIELRHKKLGRRAGKCEFKIQPKLYEGRSKNLLLKVALKESSVCRCINSNQFMIIVLRWNPLEYEESVGKPKWLVLSVNDLKTLGIDTHGYADPISLYEYKNRSTGECQLGWRLFEKSPIEKYNDQWIDWITFAPEELVEIMLGKIWHDLGQQNGSYIPLFIRGKM